MRGDLCDEATWLASLLVRLLPDDSESQALLALILLTDARRSTRVDELDGYLYYHSARGELLRRFDRVDEARVAYERALACHPADAEAAFLRRRLDSLAKHQSIASHESIHEPSSASSSASEVRSS